jgi:hypothetical protein
MSFGKYCLGMPSVFSFDPRCHGFCGSQKICVDFGRQRKAKRRLAALCYIVDGSANGCEGTVPLEGSVSARPRVRVVDPLEALI